MKKIVLFVFAVLFFQASFSTISFAGNAENNFKVCRSKLKAAQKLDVLYDLKWDGKSAPLVVVGPIYETLPFDAREGFALTINCFINAGKTDQFVNFPLLDYRTHAVVGNFSYGHLN